MMNSFLTLSRLQKQFLAILLDLIFLPLMFVLAIWMRFDVVTLQLIKQFVVLIFAAPFIAIPIFIRLGLYRAVIRFVDQKIVMVVVYGVMLTVVALLGLAVLLHVTIWSRAVFGIFGISSIMYVLASRFLARAYFVRLGRNHQAICVAIYGAGRTGVQMATAFRAGQDYSPMFLIDDKAELQGATIGGLRVYPSTDLAPLFEKFQVTEVHLMMPSISRKQKKLILDRLEQYHVKVKVTPSLTDLLNGELNVNDIREIEIEDLLGRDSVEPNAPLIAECILGKTVLVTGAGGSIGSELCRQIVRQKPARLILLDMSEYALYAIDNELAALKKQDGLDVPVMPFLGSVLDTVKCQHMLRTFAVETVYHAAAYKHVPLVEQNPIEGIRNNVFGTLSIARAAMAAGVARFVLISTDKAVRPTNVMGSTKRLAELILQAFSEKKSATRFCMVRFGNVLGSSGSVVPLFRKQIMAGGPITLTHPDITRYFMTIPEAAQLVLQAGALGEGGDVFVLDMGEPVKIIDLAKRMVHLSGLALKSESNNANAIDIVHVGLRPGEKLYEELLIGENVVGTEHPLIMRAHEKMTPWVSLQPMLERLEAAGASFDYEAVRALLLELVSEYQPQCGIEDLIWSEQQKKTGSGLPVTTQ